MIRTKSVGAGDKMKAFPAAIAADVYSVGITSSAVHTLRGVSSAAAACSESRLVGSLHVLTLSYIWI